MSDREKISELNQTLNNLKFVETVFYFIIFSDSIAVLYSNYLII